MKKVLMVTTMAYTLRAFLLPFAHHFRNIGWRVDAAASEVSNHTACTEAFDQVWDIDWSRNPFDLRHLHRAAREISALVLREGYDLVHVHTPVASFITRFAMRNRPASRQPVVIYTAHGFHFHQGGRTISNGIFRTLEKIAGRWTDYLVTINQEDYSAVGKHGIVPPEQLRYIPGIGVDLETYTPDHPVEAKAMAKRGRQRMKDFDIRHILQLHEELYAEALSR